MACGVMIFTKISNFRKNFHFILFHLIFLCFYCCSINLKRQSENSGLSPDTSSLVIDLFSLFLNAGCHLNLDTVSKNSLFDLFDICQFWKLANSHTNLDGTLIVKYGDDKISILSAHKLSKVCDEINSS